MVGSTAGGFSGYGVIRRPRGCQRWWRGTEMKDMLTAHKWCLFKCPSLLFIIATTLICSENAGQWLSTNLAASGRRLTLRWTASLQQVAELIRAVAEPQKVFLPPLFKAQVFPHHWVLIVADITSKPRAVVTVVCLTLRNAMCLPDVMSPFKPKDISAFHVGCYLAENTESQFEISVYWWFISKVLMFVQKIKRNPTHEL